MSEGRSHYFLTARGEFIFFQIIYTNVAIRPALTVAVRYYRPASSTDPGANIFHFGNHSFSGLELVRPSQDLISGRFGPLLYVVAPDGSSISVAYAHAELFMDLTLTLLADAFQRGDGRNHFIRKKSGKSDGTLLLKFMPLMRLAGRLHIKKPGFASDPFSVTGFGCMGYLAMTDGLKPYSVFEYSNFCIFQSTCASPSIALSMLTFVPTIAYSSASRLNQGMLAVNGKIWGLSVGDNLMPDGSRILYGPLLPEPVSSYKFPSSITYIWSGHSLDRRSPWSVSIHVSTIEFLDRINLLGVLPSFIAAVIRLFISNPWAFLFLEPNCSAIVNIPALSLHDVAIKGILYHELSYFTQPSY